VDGSWHKAMTHTHTCMYISGFHSGWPIITGNPYLIDCGIILGNVHWAPGEKL